MSDGTSPGTLGSAPPNITFSPAPSSRLFSIRNGPAPFQPAIACESAPASLRSEIQESTTAVIARAERDAAARALRRVSMDVAAVEHEVVRLLPGRALVRTQQHEVVEKCARRRPDLDPDEAIVMRPGIRADHGAACSTRASASSPHPWALTRVPDAGSRAAALVRTTIQPAPLLPRQRERPRVAEARLQHQLVPGRAASRAACRLAPALRAACGRRSAG
jgi:hypothetical protein